MNELWIEIPHTQGRYSISSFGSVLSNRSGKVLKTWIHTTGYWRVSLGRNNYKYVHRLIAQAFLPNPDSLAQVDHIDGNRLNLALENLRWVSQKENILSGAKRHQWQTQKQASVRRRKFVENAAEFSALHKQGRSLRWIARKFDTDHRLISSRIDQFEAQSR